MRLLVVGFAGSIHTARYLGQLDGLGWDIHLLDSSGSGPPHPDLRDLTLHVADDIPAVGLDQSVHVARHPTVDGDWAGSHARELVRLVRELKPDIVHSHEVQHAGYLMLEARRVVGEPFPPWLLSNWGSDLNLFGLEADHRARIAAVMSACDYYSAECHRDVAQARMYGFRGIVIGVWPIAGGFPLAHCRQLRAPGPSSERRAIALKGSTGRFGRCDVAVQALEQCGDRLAGYELCLYLAGDPIIERCRELCDAHGARLTVVSRVAPTDYRLASHDEILAVHGRARASISLNISDALSTSFLEAAVMGSLPIHSDTGCAVELSPAGVGALYVSPEDADQVLAAVLRALEEPWLVDAAAEANARMAALWLDPDVIRARVIDGYERILCDRLGAAVGVG